MKIIIEIETDSKKERVEQYVKRFCVDNFQADATIQIEDE